ncbi:MAG: glucosamine-6-phosphate deaminase [Proteobacteria bacterium]|nr:glucosamine-6-phosphate deaminase [Pseudomonadota bacterium]
MQILWCDSKDSFNSLAADHVLAAHLRKPDLTIALPTGRTPLGLYSVLRSKPVAFNRVRWFNLDEYVGLSATDGTSYAQFLRMHLLDDLGVPDTNIRLIRGDAADIQAECRAYDEAIARAEGLDLAILGLGANGHIAFNEPGSGWHQTTHVVRLTELTRAANAQEGQYVPPCGITMGIGTLSGAREILLLVSGQSKADALQALLQGRPDLMWPVTSLLGHPRLTVIADGRLRPG